MDSTNPTKTQDDFLLIKSPDPPYMKQTLIVSGIVFLVSIFFCLIPRVVNKVKAINRAMPYATLLSAGFLLAVLVLDFIPHMVSHDHKPSVSHEKEEFNTKTGLWVSGISFILLLGIDSCVLKHDHCDSQSKEEKKCGHSKKAEEIKTLVVEEDVVKMHEHTKHTHGDVEEGGCCNTEMIKNTNSKAKAFIFIIGISIHSFFEGLAFKSSSSFGGYEFSILLHKLLESFSIGLAFLDTLFPLAVTMGFTIFYSILTPLGMILGHFLKGEDLSIGEISISMVCQGLALGSLMFIVFIEMISTSFHKSGNNMIKIAVLFAGYLFASGIIILTHDHGSHGHGSHNHGSHEHNHGHNHSNATTS